MSFDLIPSNFYSCVEQVNEKQHHELKELRLNLKKCFTTLNCYLMPHPGLRVCTSPEFDGKLKDIERDFKLYVKKFVEGTFEPSISVKQINGREISTLELFEYFKAYCRIFESDELPEPKSMLLATAEANNLAAKALAKEFYVHAMEQVCDLAISRPIWITTQYKWMLLMSPD